MQHGSKRLRDWIERSKMNQREAAEMLDIHEVYLSQLLNGIRRPGSDLAIKIEDITGVTIRSWQLTDDSESREPATAGGKKPRLSR